MAVAVGVDVGGTKLLAVAVDEDGTITARQRLETPRGDADALVAAIAGAARHLGDGLPVGVGVAGPVSRDGTLRYGPNLDLREVPLRSLLAEATGVPVTVRNDATVALYGEARAGAAHGANDVLLLTLGTGVGGAILAGGALVEGHGGLGGELGHIVVVDGGRPCPCGVNGCLEAYASGSAVGARARERLAEEEPDTVLRDVDGVDGVDGKAVTAAALDGDAFAREVLEEAGYWLGVGMTSLVNVLDPEVVVVGGGAATRSAPILLPVARAVLAERVIGAEFRDLPDVVPASLEDDAGAIGAALLVHDERAA